VVVKAWALFYSQDRHSRPKSSDVRAAAAKSAAAKGIVYTVLNLPRRRAAAQLPRNTPQGNPGPRRAAEIPRAGHPKIIKNTVRSSPLVTAVSDAAAAETRRAHHVAGRLINKLRRRPFGNPGQPPRADQAPRRLPVQELEMFEALLCLL